MPRPLLLVLGMLFVFGAVAAIMMKLMPEPLKDSDYLVIGSVSTLISLLVLFFGLTGPRKSGDTFFKKRKKQR